MNSRPASLIQWNYFLSIESDIERLSRFVEFNSANFKAYSIEIARLLLTVSSEADVVSKQLCNTIDSASNAKNISEYREIIKKHFPEFSKGAVTIPRYDLEFYPWKDWITDSTPDWWKAYNKVKHQRDDFFALANLENVLNATSGLFILILHYYRAMGIQRIEQPPSLFSPPPELAYVTLFIGGGGMTLVIKD